MNPSEPTRPTPQRVAMRALALCACVCRGDIEWNADHPDSLATLLRLRTWLQDQRMWQELEPHEQSIVRADLGSLHERQLIDVTWAVEGAAVLAWAVRKAPLPPHDTKVNPYDTAELLDFFSYDASEIAASASLRDGNELRAYRELVYAIHTRLTNFRRMRASRDWTQWLEDGWLGALKVDQAALVRDYDLSICGAPIALAEPAQREECEWITLQRHRAILWILGDNPTYSKVSVSA